MLMVPLRLAHTFHWMQTPMRPSARGLAASCGCLNLETGFTHLNFHAVPGMMTI